MEDDQFERYARNIRVVELGEGGQEKLLASSVFVIGAGGLGSPALLYLAAAGVGRIAFVESDKVELSNLQRQVLHTTSGVSRAKAESARYALRELNPDIIIDAHEVRIDESNINGFIDGFDAVLDCSDNFETRFLVADTCWEKCIPLVSASVVRWEGQLLTVIPGEGNPCYRCMLPEEPLAGNYPIPAEVGVVGAAAGVLGSLQALETIKFLLGIDESMQSRLLALDLQYMVIRKIMRRKDPKCKFCG